MTHNSAPRTCRHLFAPALCVLALASNAFADNPLNSNEKPGSGATKKQPREGKNDFTIVPVAGGSTDIGVGGGFFAALTRDQAGYDPFVWNLSAQWFISFAAQEGKFEVPYNDGSVNWTLTRFLGRPLQLFMTAGFTEEETLYYYGMGNASTTALPPNTTKRYLQYGRIHPTVLGELAFKFVDHFAGKIGVSYTPSWLHVPPNSRLAYDAQHGSAAVRSLIGPTEGMQSVALFRYGVQFDTRDNETEPHSGTWEEATIKASPGGIGNFPYRYGQANVVLRGYIPVTKRFTIAVRLVGDWLFGDVPFAELPRYDDTYAVGGATGVRGVPAQRYYGKVKVFGNFEVRGRLVDFHLLGKELTLGAALFTDGGRVWADTSPHPDLDGTGVGIKYGVGFGVRILSGTAFVLRADLAWSPDATPIGGYVSAGETF